MVARDKSVKTIATQMERSFQIVYWRIADNRNLDGRYRPRGAHCELAPPGLVPRPGTALKPIGQHPRRRANRSITKAMPIAALTHNWRVTMA